MGNAYFYLNRHWWKGETAVSDQPIEHFDLRIDEGKVFHRYWNLDQDPISAKETVNVFRKECDDKRWLTFIGEISSKSDTPKWLKSGNPNTSNSAFIHRIDEGEVTVTENEKSLSFNFKGKKLKGCWTIPSSDETYLILKESEPPKVKPGRKKGSRELENSQLEVIYNQTKENSSRPDIAKLAKCSKNSVYRYQKLMEHYGVSSVSSVHWLF